MKYLPVYGDDHETADGTCVRDYVHVTDLARAHAQAIDYLRNGGTHLSANLGSEKPTSVLELINAVERVTGRSVPFVVKARRAGDPPILYADSSLARATLGFTTRLSAIETIVQTAAPAFGHSLRQITAA